MARSFSVFIQLCEASYDKDVMGSSQIRQTGEGGRIRPERKKSTPERRRMKAVGGGKMVPAKDYKPRSDIGSQRKTETRVQQPTQERGSADVKAKAAAAAKAERAAAARARAAAKKSGAAATTEKPKAKPKDLSKEASKLLSTKKSADKPATRKTRKWRTETGSGMTRQERDKARNKEKGDALKARKAQLIKDFTEKNGRPPKGKERTKLLGLAHSTIKSGV
jgi:hypothetical protein